MAIGKLINTPVVKFQSTEVEVPMSRGGGSRHRILRSYLEAKSMKR